MAKSAKELFSDLGFIFKFVETLVCLAMIILDVLEPCEYTLHAYSSIIVCYGGYFIICFVFVVIYIVEETHHLYEMIIIGGGGVFFLVTGIYVLVERIQDDLVLCHFVMIVFLLGNGVVMIIDLIRETKKK